MRQRGMERVVSCFLAGLLSISALAGGPIAVKASDTLPYLGESARGQNQP